MNFENRSKILTVISQIPHGNVASYGQIAKLAGIPRNSRQVGYVLKNLEAGSGIPWYRVVNSKGEISHRHDPESMAYQCELLENEGIEIDPIRRRVSLEEYGWRP